VSGSVDLCVRVELKVHEPIVDLFLVKFHFQVKRLAYAANIAASLFGLYVDELLKLEEVAANYVILLILLDVLRAFKIQTLDL
jgi:hypothetical protein